MDGKVLRDEIEEMLLKKVEKLSEMEEGTEEHTRLAGDIQKLYDKWLEEVKMDSDCYYQNVKLEHERMRDETEARLKEQQLEQDAKRHRKIKWDTILTCSVVVGLTIGICVFEANGHIFPMKLLKYVDKIKFII